MGQTEAEAIKKRWQEYTEELYKKDLHDPDNHNGVITHLEPDILECEVKWALESTTTNKVSGGDWIPVELFQILKDSFSFSISLSKEYSGLISFSWISFQSKGLSRVFSNTTVEIHQFFCARLSL